MRDALASARWQAADDILRLLDIPSLTSATRSRLPQEPWWLWSAERCWAASGAQSLTAKGARPVGDVAGRMNVAGSVLQELGRSIGKPLQVDGSALLAERAALSRHESAPAPGRTLRGHGRIIRTLDGWLAINLPRDGDLEALPALTNGTLGEGDVDGLQTWARSVPSAQILGQASLLSLAVAAVPSSGNAHAPLDLQQSVNPWLVRDLGAMRRLQKDEVKVVDFSGLWAGPLCTSLLATLGARVIRVKGSKRAETPAPLDAAFNELLAAGVEHVRLDLEGPETRSLIQDADIIVTSSRPAALQRLGMLERSGATLIRITAHGTEVNNAQRVGFGDDAAAAAGAIAYTPTGPTYAADALADPITGLLAAIAAAGSIVSGRAAVIDLSLRRSAAWALGSTVGHGPEVGHSAAKVWPAAAPRARRRASL